MSDNYVWIGIATFRPSSKNKTDKFKLASANIIFIAENESEFKHLVKKQLSAWGFIMIEMQDVELFNFDNPDGYKDNLYNLAMEVMETKNMRWGTFYVLDENDQ